MPRQEPTTIAILGTDALVEDILALLLEREGYHVRHLEAHPTAPFEGRSTAWTSCSRPPD